LHIQVDEVNGGGCSLPVLYNSSKTNRKAILPWNKWKKGQH
jgi:hypothetical protein